MCSTVRRHCMFLSESRVTRGAVRSRQTTSFRTLCTACHECLLRGLGCCPIVTQSTCHSRQPGSVISVRIVALRRAYLPTPAVGDTAMEPPASRFTRHTLLAVLPRPPHGYCRSALSTVRWEPWYFWSSRWRWRLREGRTRRRISTRF